MGTIYDCCCGMESSQSTSAKEKKAKKDVKIGRYTSTIMPLVKRAAVKSVEVKSCVVNHIPIPTDKAKKLEKKPLLNGLLHIPITDEDIDMDSFAQIMKEFIFNITLTKVLYPIVDSEEEFVSMDAAIKWRDSSFSDLSLKPNVEWKELQSDHAMSLLAFSGRPCTHTHLFDADKCPFYIKKECVSNIVYVNDYTNMSKYAKYCRNVKLFFTLGAALYFNAKYELIAMYVSEFDTVLYAADENKTESKEWSNGKVIWKASSEMFVDIGIHLVHIHLIEGDSFATATRENLSPNHCIRRFLRPFTYRTSYINYSSSNTLLSDGGLAHRMQSLTFEGLAAFGIDMYESYRFVPFLQRFDNEVAAKVNDDNIFPMAKDCQDYWNITYEFVESYLRLYYKCSFLLFLSIEFYGFFLFFVIGLLCKYNLYIYVSNLIAYSGKSSSFILNQTISIEIPFGIIPVRWTYWVKI